MSSDLNIEFQEAFNKISDLKQAVTPDVLLKFYAYYKQANYGSNFSFSDESNVRSAFKLNAWMQLKDMSSEDAKREYIKLANSILIDKK